MMNYYLQKSLFCTIVFINLSSSQFSKISILSDYKNYDSLEAVEAASQFPASNDSLESSLYITPSNAVAQVNKTESKSRSKRFIYKNVYGTFDVGIQAVIPYTIILPPISNLFNKWRSKRSLRNSNTLLQDDDIYEDDPFVQKYLDRIASYFELIQIPESTCQQRAICEFSADPSKYYPIAGLFLTQLRAVPSEYYVAILNSTAIKRKEMPPSRFELLTSAADRGLIYGHQDCHNHFSDNCFYSTEQRLDMSVLKYWQMLESLLRIKVQDQM